MYRSNGLVDDFAVYGTPEDYVNFSASVKTAILSSSPVALDTSSSISIVISKNDEFDELFTSLQNKDNQYFSHKDWEGRSILRVIGSEPVLKNLHEFLQDISGRGKGYSYISEYSEPGSYSIYSPQWRLYVEST